MDSITTIHPNLSKEFLERLLKVAETTPVLENNVVREPNVVLNVSITIKDGKATINQYELKKIKE